VSTLHSVRTHAAQFFEGEPFLHRGIASFLAGPMRSGHHTVMISARHTFTAVVEYLRATGEPALVAGGGRIVFVDTDDAIRQFMVGTTVDPVRVEQNFKQLLAQVRGVGNAPVWIYGDMAGALCRRGNYAAARSLEELWNVHFPEPEFSVLCGYPIEVFDHDADAHMFQAICAQHTHVIPTEDFTDAIDERARLVQVALLQQRRRASEAAASRRHTAAGSVATAAPLVYVIDDDLSVRRSLSRLLVVGGCEVRVCASADEFLDDGDRRAARCLILDVQLVGLSSQELQVRLGHEPEAVPVIAMSGSHAPWVEAEARRLGAMAFLRKPFEGQKLMDAIGAALANCSVRDARSSGTSV
jgi:CheY-like chemotaxis protein